MSNIALFPPSDAQLNEMPLLASIQYYDPRPASSINKLLNGLLPSAIYEQFNVVPSAGGLSVTVQASGGLALVSTANGELIKVQGQHNIDLPVSVGTQYIYLVANFAHNTITKQVDTSSAINPADIIVSNSALETGLLLATVTVTAGATNVLQSMISTDGVQRFSFDMFTLKTEFSAHNHDESYLAIDGKAKSAINADRFGGELPAHYARSSQVLTDVPVNAKFTDTQLPLSSSVASESTTTAASSKSVKQAYDKGEEALQKANTKLDENATAANSNKLGNQTPDYYAKASDVKTPVPVGAVFTDTQRPVSSSVASTSTTTAANSAAAKTAYDKGVEALNKANTKLDSGATAVNSLKLEGKNAAYFAKATDVQTPVPAGAVFTDTNTWRAVVDSLTSTAADKSLSANQGRIIKQMIDQINALLTSDDSTLNEIQEVVNFIKQNRETLDSLTIDNIAGLRSALDNAYNKGLQALGVANTKLGKSETAENSNGLAFKDTRSSNDLPNQVFAKKLTAHFKQTASVDNPPVTSSTPEYSHILNVCGWDSSATSGGLPTQLSIGVNGIAFRPAESTTSWGSWQQFWHSGNMGASSGLDADMVDGLQAEQLARVDAKTNFSKPISILGNVVEGSSAQLQIKGFMRVGTIYISEGLTAEGGGEPLENSGGKLKWNSHEIFHYGNMGTGSNLDAGKLEGQRASYFAKASDVKTPVPVGAVFTDTQRPLSSSVASTSTTTAATSAAAKEAYDRGTEALNKANEKLDANATAANSSKLGNQAPSYYARAEDLKTPVPVGAVFTDTQRPVSSSVASTSTTTAANSAAAKTAYDKGVEALNKANEKLDANATAANSNKLGNKAPSEYVQTSGDQTVAGKKTFTSEIGVGNSASIKFDAATDSIVFLFG